MEPAEPKVFRRTNVIGPYRYPLAWVTVPAEPRFFTELAHLADRPIAV
ncbi:hypothetical protein ACF1BP_35710 [Streptomyces sp. NPDC014735]|nr:hypothetical protein [Streptomyces sp. CB01580]